MKKMILSSFLLLSSFAKAAPECQYQFQLANATIEVLETSQVIQQNFTISRGQNSPSGKCSNYRVFFSKGFSNSYQRRAMSLGGYYVNYNLHRTINQAGVLKEFGDAVSSNEYVDGTAPARHTTYTNHFFISVPGTGAGIVRSGTYYDIVQASVYGRNPNSDQYTFEETDNFTVVFYIPKRIEVSLIDEGGSFDPNSTSKVMDFGVLSQNQERGADFRVTSNGSYQIRISSQNNGKLKRSSSDTISYGLKVNGSNVALGNSATHPVSIGSGNATSNAGDKYNLKVTITENTSHKAAGLYQDILTITAISN